MSSHWLQAHPPNDTQIPAVSSLLKDFSAEALGQLRTWLEQNPPAVPITSILGFSQFTANVATDVATQETTTSTTYTDLATVGPSLSNLPDGKYLLLYGCMAKTDAAGNGVYMSVQVNATAASDSDVAYSESGNFISVMRATAKTFSNGGNNSVTVKYKSTAAHTATFLNRWLIALRYANP